MLRKKNQAEKTSPQGQEKASSRSQKVLHRLSSLFILLGILGLCLPLLNNLLLRRNQTIDLSSLDAESLKRNAESVEYVPMDEIREIGYFNFWSDLGKYRPDEIVGEVFIPSESIALPIFGNARNANLLAGVGQLFPDRRAGEGNYVISGHRASGKGILLHNLMDVKEGATVYITDLETLYIYRVIHTVEKATDAVNMLSEDQTDNYGGKPIVSIMTCYNGKSSSRWFVIAELEETLPYDPTLIQ